MGTTNIDSLALSGDLDVTGTIRGNVDIGSTLKLGNGESIVDTSNNELLKVAVTSSAVNEVSIANAATGNPPRVGATGDDTNIDLGLGGKGTGIVRFDGGSVPATSTASGGAATANAQCSIITSESLTTAAGSDYTLTLTNTKIASTSLVLAQVGLGTSTQGIPLMYKVTPGSGSVTLVIKNIHAALAFNGTIIVRVVVF